VTVLGIDTQDVHGNDATPVATPQISMKRGIHLFGDHGVEAVRQEMLQLQFQPS
jgi:hypothetical protein